MAIDTGSTYTVIDPQVAARLGYATDLVATVPVTTASGTIRAPRVKVERVDALGSTRRDFNVVVHALPPTLRLSGLLGLDFVRSGRLTFDFQRGEVSYEEG